MRHTTEITLVNRADEILAERGIIERGEVRRLVVHDALVDTAQPCSRCLNPLSASWGSPRSGRRGPLPPTAPWNEASIRRSGSPSWGGPGHSRLPSFRTTHRCWSAIWSWSCWTWPWTCSAASPTTRPTVANGPWSNCARRFNGAEGAQECGEQLALGRVHRPVAHELPLAGLARCREAGKLVVGGRINLHVQGCVMRHLSPPPTQSANRLRPHPRWRWSRQTNRAAPLGASRSACLGGSAITPHWAITRQNQF